MIAAAVFAALVCVAQSSPWDPKFTGQTNAEMCPGNLMVNGGFESPNTIDTRNKVKNPTANSRWGWYKAIPGWYTTRPDGLPCVKVDWQSKYIEIARGALATPAEGKQYGELLPNGTGNYCQDLQLQKGARYKLSYYYGRLMTHSNHGTGAFEVFPTAVNVAIRPSDYKPSASSGIWPHDRQGYTQISAADTEVQWEQYKKQWVRYEAEFVAPANKVTLAFINAKRPKNCGSCGSLIDAVCLQKMA
eukprot:GHUV01005267.1.p1 GENE.GHUV01005267.1~~GHUV01005267.1.p1  ORF type:complete len:246 (+),score=37.75 GHUV01005267.1:194-931(+)